jgi:multidrug efflux pump subunit AcrB
VLGVIALFLVGSVFLFYRRDVVVKMLPFDNKSELQLMVGLPEETTLEETACVTKRVAEYVRTIPELRD